MCYSLDMNKRKIQLAIITGVSGAGKTITLSNFEENQYVVIDNIPLTVIPSLFLEFKKKPILYHKVALSVNLAYAKKVYELAKNDEDFSVIFLGLDCSKDVLLERFKLNRRIHPLQHKGRTLLQCIKEDQFLINSLREEFTHYIDTSKTSLFELRSYLNSNIFSVKEGRMIVNFISFGFKKSVPLDTDMVIDVRTLPNPYWVNELRELTGLDQNVKDYIFSSPKTTEFLKHLTDYLSYYLIEVEHTNRKAITIGIACSGGQHRSVAIAEYLKDYYSKKYNTSVAHRDLINK